MYLKQLQYLLIRLRHRDRTATADELQDVANVLHDLIEQLIEHETNGK